MSLGGLGAGPVGAIPWGGAAGVLGSAFYVEGVRQISPRGVEVWFSKALSAAPAVTLPASYAVQIGVPPTESWTVTAVYTYTGDQRSVYLEVDRLLTYGETFTVIVDPAVTSADGDVLAAGDDTGTFDARECYSEDVPRDHGAEAILPVLTDALGRQLSLVAGFHFTTTLEPVTPATADLVVNSTLGMPDAGRVRIGAKPHNHWWTYTGREPHRLTGAALVDPDDLLLVPQAIDLDTPAFGTLPAGSLVLDWGRDYSVLDRAIQSATITQADGRMLDRVGFYPRPPSASDDVYRGILLALEYKEKSVWRALYALLRAVFRDYLVDMPGRVLNLDRIEGAPVGTDAWRGCYVEMGTPWLASEQVPDRTAYQVRYVDTGVGALVMETRATPWTAGWTVRAVPEIDDAVLLPFTIEELRVPGSTRMPLRIGVPREVLEALPATYLHDVVDSAGGGWPINGYLAEDAAEAAPAPGDPGQPLFLFDDTVDSYLGTWFSRLLRYVLPAGTRVETVVLG